MIHLYTDRIYSILVLLFILPFQVHAEEDTCSAPIDLVVGIESSGSAGLDNSAAYFSEFTFLEMLLGAHSIGETSTHVGVVNYAGCGNDVGYADCRFTASNTALSRNRLMIEQQLSSSEADTLALFDEMQMDIDENNYPDGLLSSYTWPDAALTLAQEIFDTSGREEARKVFVLLVHDETSQSDHKLCYDNSDHVNLIAFKDAGHDLFVFDVGEHDANYCESFADYYSHISSFSASSYTDKITANPDGDDLCGDADLCPNDALNDYDNDGICGDVDNDNDADGVINESDACPLGLIGSGNTPATGDIDGDGCDNSEDDDIDGDGLVNTADPYPNDSIMGFDDNDKDGLPDDCSVGDCGAMPEDLDDDNDGIRDENDAFPLVSIYDLDDSDRDGAPDSCEGVDCRGMSADNDDDNDGINDELDIFPLINNALLVDENGDLIPDICNEVDCSEQLMDVDQDGIPDICEELDCKGQGVFINHTSNSGKNDSSAGGTVWFLLLLGVLTLCAPRKNRY